MARNKSEKRTPLEQEVYDYIKAWVEYSCTEEYGNTRYYKAGISTVSFSRGPGKSMWHDLSNEGQNRCHCIPHGSRRKWLHAQK